MNFAAEDRAAQEVVECRELVNDAIVDADKVLNLMIFVLEMTDFVMEMTDFALKMMDFVLKMMDMTRPSRLRFASSTGEPRSQSHRRSSRRLHGWVPIK